MSEIPSRHLSFRFPYIVHIAFSFDKAFFYFSPRLKCVSGQRSKSAGEEVAGIYFNLDAPETSQCLTED